MTFPTVAVTVKLVSLDGTPYPNVTVTAKLDQDDLYQGFIVKSEAKATTDSNGEAVLNLFPNNPTTGLGTTGSTYKFSAQVGQRTWHATAQVPNEDCSLDAIADLEAQAGVTEAQAAEQAAQGYAAAASGSATAAAASAAAAQASADAAAASVDAVADDASAAAASATSAAGSAAAAGSSAASASTSATGAAASASTASTAASDAANSATAAASSASNAAGSASDASDSAAAADASAAAAAASATSAAGSATSASGSASDASDNADAAAASATAAATSEGNAASSATAAAGSATAAAGSATAAATSESNAAATLADAVRKTTTSTISAGYTITPYNAGSKSGGVVFTPAPANGNYQYLTNDGPFTLGAPAADCGMSIQVTNGAAAGNITFSGFTVGVNKGDILDTIAGHVFRIRIERINGVSTYSVQALQ